jgi:plasmid stabilization system protein ParE
LTLTLAIRIKPRAALEIEKAAHWWFENRPAAPGAVRLDLEAALALLTQEPGIGTKVQLSRVDALVRRLYLPRVKYFVYYRVRGSFLEVITFWHSSRKNAPSI